MNLFAGEFNKSDIKFANEETIDAEERFENREERGERAEAKNATNVERRSLQRHGEISKNRMYATDVGRVSTPCCDTGSADEG